MLPEKTFQTFMADFCYDHFDYFNEKYVLFATFNVITKEEFRELLNNDVDEAYYFLFEEKDYPPLKKHIKSINDNRAILEVDKDITLLVSFNTGFLEQITYPNSNDNKVIDDILSLYNENDTAIEYYNKILNYQMNNRN